MAISNQLVKDRPDARQLILTGSMVAGAYDLPPNLDIIKLPALTKRSDGQYSARSLPLSLAATIAWREQMILQAAIAFEPDLFLVDKTPAGVHGELLPTLRFLKTWRPMTRLLLGMRDIEDNREATRVEWEISHARQLHEKVYDGLLYYGERKVFDPVSEYGMSPRAASKLISCGYLAGAQPTRSREILRKELDAGDRPLIVVTVGGGGDGFILLKTYIDALETDLELADAQSLLVTGPLMTRSDNKILSKAAHTSHLQQLKFTPDLVSYLAAADLVVSMAGYNTVCEILSQGVRSLLVPRVKPRQEQKLRAELLAERGLVRILLPDILTPERLANEIHAALNAPPPKITLKLDGLQRASQNILKFIDIGHPEPSLVGTSTDHGQLHWDRN